MDALLPTFLAALFAGMGDKPQQLAAQLAARFDRAGMLLAGIAAAAFISSLAVAFGGRLVADLINFRAIGLLLGLALLGAGVDGLLRRKPAVLPAPSRFGAFTTAVTAILTTSFGDRTQFLTFAFAARADSLWLASVGATAGIVAAAAPAVVLGKRMEATLPIRAIRIGAAIMFLIAGILVAAAALRLL